MIHPQQLTKVRKWCGNGVERCEEGANQCENGANWCENGVKSPNPKRQTGRKLKNPDQNPEKTHK
jgi:hypothetical protein